MPEYLQKMFINRDFGLLFLGRLVSRIGEGIHYFALAWLVLDLTGSGAALGSILMVGSLPAVLLAPFSGVLADSLPRKPLVVGMDVVRGGIMLGLAAIYSSGNLSLPLLYAATIALGLANVLFEPAITATLPSLVEKDQLVTANARDSLSASATGILGPIVGAFLLGGFGYFGIFLINGISFLLSAVSETFIRFPPQRKATVVSNARSEFLRNLKEGFFFIWQNPGLRVLMAGGLVVNFLFNPLFGVVMPFFGREILLMSPEHYGLSQAAFPVGMLFGTLVVTWLAKKMPKFGLLIGSLYSQGLIVIVLGLIALPAVFGPLSPTAILITLAVPVFMMGIANVQVNVPLQVMMQETVPDDYRGRVFAMFGSLMQMSAPLGMAVFGFLLDMTPIHVFFLTCGIIVVITTSALGLSSSLRALVERNEKESPATEG